MIPSYRLEVFDFSSFPALTGNYSLNAGPEDQRLGMEWIRRNIQLWGNPHKIAVFGACAGAHCLQRHLTGVVPPCGYAVGHVNDLATRHGGHKHQPQGTAAPKVFSTSADSGVRLDRLSCLPLDNMLLYTPILEKSNTTYYRVLHSSDLAFIFDIRQRQQYQAPRQHKSGSGMPCPLLGPRLPAWGTCRWVGDAAGVDGD